jgi:dolichol-phosphate mannosyltransferase
MCGVVPELAIIVPVYNEEGNILPLAEEVAIAFLESKWDYELVFVDDASTDGTWSRIQQANSQTARVRGIRHSRNSGQSAALWTGVSLTTSPILATMDGDRQNDPADFPKLLAELNQYDFVCGIRARRKDNVRRRLSAGIARYARRLVLKVDFVDTGCGMRVFRRSALAGVFPFNGWHRFLPVLVHGAGARTREVAVNHRPRIAGVSKYGIWDRLGRGIVDLLAVAWYQRRRLNKLPLSQEPLATSENDTSEADSDLEDGSPNPTPPIDLPLRAEH